MAAVEPIRDLEVLDEYKLEVRRRSYRDYIIVLLGLNTGLRIGDILPLKVKDVMDKTHINIYEQKTGKAKRFPIMNIGYELNQYIKTERLEKNDYLFESRQVNSEGIKSYITVTQAYRRLKSVANDLGIESFGTHSLRKSFGYHFYNMHKDVAQLMTIFNHSSPSITLRYIGITQDAIDESMMNFKL